MSFYSYHREVYVIKDRGFVRDCYYVTPSFLDVCTTSIMDSIWNNLLYLGRQPFLQDLRYLRIARGMRHLARVLVAVGVVC
jgi:hypothetical protein